MILILVQVTGSLWAQWYLSHLFQPDNIHKAHVSRVCVRPSRSLNRLGIKKNTHSFRHEAPNNAVKAETCVKDTRDATHTWIPHRVLYSIQSISRRIRCWSRGSEITDKPCFRSLKTRPRRSNVVTNAITAPFTQNLTSSTHTLLE